VVFYNAYYDFALYDYSFYDTLVAQPTETYSIIESLVRTWINVRNTTESVSFSDSLVRYYIYTRQLTDSLTITESLSFLHRRPESTRVVITSVVPKIKSISSATPSIVRIGTDTPTMCKSTDYINGQMYYKTNYPNI
jgi:hypothetical protein